MAANDDPLGLFENDPLNILPKRVEVLGVGIVEFPGDMDEAAIAEVLSREFPKPQGFDFSKAKYLGPNPERNAFAVANDTMVDIANSATGMVKAGVDLFAPDSAVSSALGDFIKSGEQKQSDWKQASREQLARDLQAADGEWSKAGAYLKHAVTEDPLGTAAQVAGNMAPFAVAGRALQGASAAARTATMMGMGGGLTAGEVRGNIWQKINDTPDAELIAASREYAALREVLSEADAKREIGAQFLRNLPEVGVAGAIGALGGKFGLEGMAAGVAPRYGGRLLSGAVGVADEASQGAVEQLASNAGVRRALPEQALWEDVALNAAQEGILGVGAVARPAVRPQTPEEILVEIITRQEHDSGQQDDFAGMDASGGGGWIAPAQPGAGNQSPLPWGDTGFLAAGNQAGAEHSAGGSEAGTPGAGPVGFGGVEPGPSAAVGGWGSAVTTDGQTDTAGFDDLAATGDRGRGFDDGRGAGPSGAVRPDQGDTGAGLGGTADAGRGGERTGDAAHALHRFGSYREALAAARQSGFSFDPVQTEDGSYELRPRPQALTAEGEAFAGQVEPVSFAEAEALRNGSDTHATVPHPGGDGFMLIPREWIAPATPEQADPLGLFSSDQAEGLTITRRDTGELLVSGPAAREKILAAVPGAKMMRRGDGSVLVGRRHADQVEAALASVKPAGYAERAPDAIAGDIPLERDDDGPIPNSGGADSLERRDSAGRAGAEAGARPVLAVRQSPDEPGIYHVRTQLVTTGERDLPVDRVQTWQDSARVFSKLSRFAVEHMDGLVVDGEGRPLALIGGFKGGPAQATIDVATLIGELSQIDGAAGVWLTHNHPSGNPELSDADRRVAQNLAELLRDSGVTFHGLAAVGRDGGKVKFSTTDYDNGEVSADEPGAFRVPIVEREITENGAGEAITGPAQAKRLVQSVARDNPGVVFLDTQNRVSAFVPFDGAAMGELRRDGRLMRLFRAASTGGATGAIIAMPGGRVSVADYQNVGKALGASGVRVLDGIRYDSADGPAESLLAAGIDSPAPSTTFRSESATSTTSELDAQVFAAAVRGDLDAALTLIEQKSDRPYNRELAGALRRLGLGTKLSFKPSEHEGVKGSFRGAQDAIELHSLAGAEQVFLHEVMHAASARAIAAKHPAAVQMASLLKAVRKHFEGTPNAEQYGLTNAYEFTAEAFTNPDFQAALSQFKVSPPRGRLITAWQAFLTSVRRLIGLDASKETALGKALHLGAQLMEANKTTDYRDPLGIFNSEHHPATDRQTLRAKARGWIAQNRGWMLGALTRDQLADIYSAEIPEAGEFDHVAQKMDAARNALAERADEIIEKWRRLSAEEADRLADVMHEATIEQFDPADPQAAPSGIEQRAIAKAWAALTPEAQAIYKGVRDTYEGTLVRMRNGLSKRAERAGTAGKKIAAQIRLEFDKALSKGPYFPLSRFGDLLLIGRSPTGERTVEAFESGTARDARAAELRRAGYSIKLTAKRDYNASVDAPAADFVGQVLKLIDGTAMDARQKSALMDGLNQLSIAMLPDQSARKHFAHRKAVPGFSQDAMRAFAASMQHAGHHLARVLHGDELQLTLDGLNKRLAEAKGDADLTEQQQVANELGRRLEYMLNPNTHPVAAALGQVGFVMSLGGSVAAGLVNLTQTPLVTFPWLGAKFGWGAASQALTKASKDYFAGRWDKWSGFVVKDSPALTADERKAMRELEDAGLVNLSQAHDLAGVANTDRASSKRAFAVNRAMKVISWTFHLPEVFNRQVSGLAAYRLARSAGKSHEAAVELAGQTLRRTHFDYSASNRARWMQGNFTRVISMFKQYSQNMTYALWRNAYLALKSETPEVRREARRMLLGVGAMHFAAAGSLGLPLGVFGISPLLGLLAMGMGDDDTPWDWEVEYRNWLADTFGKAAGEAIAKGPARLLVDVDIASRVGLGELWVRPPQGEHEGRDLVEAWMLTLAGPVAGYVGNLGTAAQAFSEGKLSRGVEALVPKFIRDPLKAMRFEREGVTSWKGDDMGVNLDGGDLFAQAIGFQPAALAEMFEARSAVKGREARLQNRASELRRMWVEASLAGDQGMRAEVLDQVKAFNEKNPAMRITGQSLRQAVATKRRNARQIEDGIYLTKKREPLREAGRFANVQRNGNEE